MRIFMSTIVAPVEGRFRCASDDSSTSVGVGPTLDMPSRISASSHPQWWTPRPVHSGAYPFEVKRRRDGMHATLIWQMPGWQPTGRGPFAGSNPPFGMNFGDSGWPAGNWRRQGLLGFYDLTQADQALAALRQSGT